MWEDCVGGLDERVCVECNFCHRVGAGRVGFVTEK